ncbi:AAA family ATPase [Bacteroides sp. 519]|uniref:AAA family ATPase n=1 Tax=Bacteroides sp. 519 TaxID=2302937 RepID=UPI0013D779B6|nr:AAA family ATPase [Bacteroides sp. 519]NDV59287.1 hypothetical protein [Bacteroides sp. 519]
MNGIGFENFRVFADRSIFEFAPITVLTGANSSGKSTLIKGMKLMQSFWMQQGLGNILDFEKGNHLLGDFEMCISKKSSNKDSFKIIYQLNHFLSSDLFKDLFIELKFKFNKKNLLKNGTLESFKITTKENIVIYQFFLDEQENDEKTGEYTRYKGIYLSEEWNFEYLFNNILPVTLELISEFKNYRKIEHQKNLFEKSFEKSAEESKKIYGEQGVDYEKFKRITYLMRHLKNISLDEPSSFNDLIFIDLFSQIPISNYNLFTKELWKITSIHFPSITEKYNFESFSNLLKMKNIGTWISDLISSGEETFDSYFRKNQNIALNTYSQYRFTNNIPINELDYWGMQLFDYKSWDLFSSYDAQNLFSYPEKAKTKKDNSVINIRSIIHDAICLEEHITGTKPVSPIDSINSIIGSLKLILQQIAFGSIKRNAIDSYFIDSVRANSQRFYSFSAQETEFHSFLIDFLKQEYNDKEISFIRKWLQEYEIANDYEIEMLQGAGSQIFLIKGDQKINLVDLGYGITQLLPIILKIVYCHQIGKKTIILEEPEANLHPKFQSKLADFFLDSYKTFGIQFIIETHSEYLIRKLQYLTVKGNAKPEDTIIYYIDYPEVEKREVGESQIRTIHIKSNGQLTKPFGAGFTDESTYWIKEMFMYSN